MTQEFTATRTMLANAMATAGAELTDERIAAIWQNLDGKSIIAGENPLNWNALLRRAFARAIEREVRSAAREQVRNEAQWISVDERLPDDDCRVLAATWFTMTHDQHIDIVSFRRGSGQFSHSDVTHWMPLPRPPKEAP